MCDLPLIGWWGGNSWCTRNLNHQPSGSNQSGVHVLGLSLKLLFSTWVGTLVPVEELRDMNQTVLYIP